MNPTLDYYKVEMHWEITVVNERSTPLTLKLARQDSYTDSIYCFYWQPNSNCTLSAMDTSLLQVDWHDYANEEGNKYFLTDSIAFAMYLITTGSVNSIDTFFINPFPFPEWKGKTICDQYVKESINEWCCYTTLSDTIWFRADTVLSTIDVLKKRL
jgi:hypothetical protein